MKYRPPTEPVGVGDVQKDIKKSQVRRPDFPESDVQTAKHERTDDLLSSPNYTGQKSTFKESSEKSSQNATKSPQIELSENVEERAEKIPCSELHEHIRDVLRFCGSISQKKEKPLADFKNRKREDRRDKYSVSRLSDDRILFTKAITINGNNEIGNLKRIGISFNPDLANRKIGTVNLFLDYMISQTLDVVGDPKIRLSLASLVEKGMYNKVSDAKAAMIKTIIPILSDLMIHGITESPQKLFLRFNLEKKGLVTVYLNPEINWISLFKKRWVYLPLGYYSLSPRASELCHYIGYLLRLKSQRELIPKKLPYNLSLKSICNHLYLPQGTKRLKQLIIEPIRQDLEAITEAQKLFYAPKEAFELDFEQTQKILDEMPAACFEFIFDSEEDSRTLLESGSVSVIMHDPISFFYRRIKKQADDNEKKRKSKK